MVIKGRGGKKPHSKGVLDTKWDQTSNTNSCLLIISVHFKCIWYIIEQWHNHWQLITRLTLRDFVDAIMSRRKTDLQGLLFIPQSAPHFRFCKDTWMSVHWRETFPAQEEHSCMEPKIKTSSYWNHSETFFFFITLAKGHSQGTGRTNIFKVF